MKRKIFNDLNSQQLKAVQHIRGPSIILAGAGSGKTKVLVSKVINLIVNHKVSPSSVLMITFTNKAASEMKRRITEHLSAKDNRLGFIGTFHSFCAMILRRDGENINVGRGFTIYDEADQESVIKQIIKTMDNKGFSTGYFSNRISVAKNQLISPDNYEKIFSDYNAHLVAEVYGKYQKELVKNNSLDFDDLIFKVIELFKKKKDILGKYQFRYQYVFVDEFQDTNHSQYCLTKLIAKKTQNITVVGDFSQSIYSWRGADIQNLEKFKQDFVKTQVYYLEQNYRSTENILNFAYDVISKNQTHPVLDLFTNNKKGEDVIQQETENEEQEAIFISNEIEMIAKNNSYRDIAVLYRTNAQSRAIEEVFLHCGIPYMLVGGTRFYERKEVKDVLSYLRLLVNHQDNVSQQRIIKIGKRKWQLFNGIREELAKSAENKATAEIIDEIFARTGYLKSYNPDNDEDYARLENIRELKSVAMVFSSLTEFLQQVALVESEYFDGEKKERNKQGVRLMTLHQAKGLEFNFVFITGLEEGLLPHGRSIDDRFSLEEERRLFYVGITRARDKLYITYARRRFIFGRRTESVKSRFLGGEIDNWYN